MLLDVRVGTEHHMARVFLGQWWLALFLPFGGGEGFTFRRWIFLRGQVASAAILRHEAVHVRQYLRYGTLVFMAYYLWGALVCFVLRRPISEHPLEAPAYQSEEPFK